MIMIIMPGSGVAHLWEVDRGRRISEFDWGWGSGISTECMKVKVRWLDFCKDYFS